MKPPASTSKAQLYLVCLICTKTKRYKNENNMFYRWIFPKMTNCCCKSVFKTVNKPGSCIMYANAHFICWCLVLRISCQGSTDKRSQNKSVRTIWPVADKICCFGPTFWMDQLTGILILNRKKNVQIVSD